MHFDEVIIENQIGPSAIRMKNLQGMITMYFIQKGSEVVYWSSGNKLRFMKKNKSTYKERKKLSILITNCIVNYIFFTILQSIYIFLKRLYFDQLPFRKSVQESVRNMMLQEDNSAYRLSYKTASIITESNQTETWTIGWIEENRHVYFFVNLMKNNANDKSPETTSVKVTKNILTHYGFFKGLK
jgi:hypothetical protein